MERINYIVNRYNYVTISKYHKTTFSYTKRINQESSRASKTRQTHKYFNWSHPDVGHLILKSKVRQKHNSYLLLNILSNK